MQTEGLEKFSRLNRTLEPEHRRFLSYWFWTWPLMGMFLVEIHYFYQEIYRNCEQSVFIPGLVEAVPAGWTIVRAGERGSSLQIGGSAIISAVGVTMFTRATQSL